MGDFLSVKTYFESCRLFFKWLLLPLATKLREGNVFTPVCDSVHRGSLSWGDLFPGGVCLEGSLNRWVLCTGGWYLSRGGSLSRRVSVQGGLCTEGGLCPGESLYRGRSLSRGSLSRGGLCTGGLWSLSGGSLSGRPPYGNVRALRILLECILVLFVAAVEVYDSTRSRLFCRVFYKPGHCEYSLYVLLFTICYQASFIII